MKFKSKVDGFVFEAKEGSIHFDVLIKSKEYELIKEDTKKKTK